MSRDGTGCPVRIRGVVYISQRAAARAFGVHERTIAKALDGGYLDEIGIKRRGGHPGFPCVYRGAWYRSMTAAALANGVKVAAVSKAVRKARERAA